ncbi:MAG: DUF167 family protein [Gammaproteobacteria bacterium]
MRVQARSNRNEIAATQGERLTVRVVGAPIEGQANCCLMRMLAKEFRVPLSAVTMQTGKHGRDKRVAIDRPQVFPDWFSACCQTPEHRLAGEIT